MLKCNDCDKQFSEDEWPENLYGSVRCLDCRYVRGDAPDPEDEAVETPDVVEFMENSETALFDSADTYGDPEAQLEE